MADNRSYIDIVHGLSLKGYQLRDVYRNIKNRELFLMAYGKLYANAGSMTPGNDPEDIVDGMSMRRIDDIIDKLNNGSYEWKPVRRTHIPKKNNKKRPIGMPPWSDKLLQEVIRMVLEAYYEPKFSNYSHGFRPERGCHTALKQIKNGWTGVKWFIEIDIKGCFENIDHDIVLDILARDIKDTRFLKLIRTMLKAGYMENWKYHETLSGTPQGGVVSPILANIVLNELDKFVENELLSQYNRGKRRKKTPEFQRVQDNIKRAKKKGDRERVKELTKELRRIPSVDPNDPEFRRLKYSRYADDLILGFAGPKEEAIQIKERIKEFLQTIGLEMSEEKTLITNALLDNARYLGYNIKVNKDNTRLTNRDRNKKRNKTQRSINYKICLRVPEEKSKEWVRKHTRNGKPIHRTELIQMSDFEIVQTYGQELRGIVNYYSLAENVAVAFYPVKTVSIQSAASTIARKHKTNKRKVYRKYKRKSEYGMTALIVDVPNPNNPNKPLRAQLGEKPIRVDRDTIINDQIYRPQYSRNELTRRMLANECELCGSTEEVKVHHIKRLADIKKRYKGKPNPPQWVKFMMERNRKTVVVCKKHHRDIHAGRYDGNKVE